MATENERIVRLLEKTFDKQPWYGSSIMQVIKDVKPEITESRQGGAHSIIELVQHMISWRIFATKRLLGDTSYEVSEEMNFPKSITWEAAIKNLRSSQQALVEATKNFPDHRLGELVPSKTQKYTYYTLLHGIIQHDIYHLGQIAYIQKSLN